MSEDEKKGVNKTGNEDHNNIHFSEKSIGHGKKPSSPPPMQFAPIPTGNASNSSQSSSNVVSEAAASDKPSSSSASENSSE